MSEQEHKKTRVRSPAYPAFDLGTAIDRIKTIYQHEKRSAAPVGVVTKHFGIDIKSSGGLRLISALKQFGLVVEEGNGQDRKIRVSETALDLILAESETTEQYVRAMKRAALSPKIHQLLWEHYEGELPSDATLKAHLVRNLEFNDSMVDGFISELRSTIALAMLSKHDKIIRTDSDPAAVDDVMPVRFPKPLDDLETTSVEPVTPRGRASSRRANMTATTKESQVREDVFTVGDGNIVVQWPERMTADEIEDFEDWIKIVVRKVKRSTNATKSTDEENE